MNNNVVTMVHHIFDIKTHTITHIEKRDWVKGKVPNNDISIMLIVTKA